MPTVEFNLTDGSPRIVRTTNVPALSAATFIFEFQITSYEDWFELLSWEESTAADFHGIVLIEVEAAGNIYIGKANGGGAGFATTNVLTGSPTARHWFALTSNGTTLQSYYQAFGGSFTTGASTAIPTGWTPGAIQIGASAGFLADGEGTANFGAYKIYNAVLTSGEIQQEFTRRTPVRMSNLVFANDCHQGTGNNAINIDQSGTGNFTLTGTPTTLTTGQPGAPWKRRPYLFVASAEGGAGISGSGSAALSAFAVAASGLVVFSGSASAAAAPFAASGSGAEGYSGSGSAALASFAASASGAESFVGSGSSAVAPFGIAALGTFAIPAPMARPAPRLLGYPSRLPAPPGAVLGSGFLTPAVTAESHSGAAAAALQPFGASGTGFVTFSGSGSATLPSFAITGSGGETFSGTGSGALSPFASSGSGAESFTGSAGAAAQPFAISGSGSEAFSGSASAATSTFAASATGSEAFTGSASAALAPFACSATGAEAFTGSCSVALRQFAVSAVGTTGDAFNGEATCAMAPFAASGSGLETFTGTGSSALTPFAVSATGAELFTGSASSASPPFSSAGTGAVGESVTGTGSAALAAFASSGTGTEVFSGTGSAALRQFACTATGTESFSGSCSATLRPFACSGSGLHIEDIVGTAACAFSRFGVTGSGVFAGIAVGPARVVAFTRAGNGASVVRFWK